MESNDGGETSSSLLISQFRPEKASSLEAILWDSNVKRNGGYKATLHLAIKYGIFLRK
jgi:hypothetical protein